MLNDTEIDVKDFVNIIQHPGGMKKQIALYHNLVVYSDVNRVQYLTDTLPDPPALRCSTASGDSWHFTMPEVI